MIKKVFQKSIEVRNLWNTWRTILCSLLFFVRSNMTQTRLRSKVFSLVRPWVKVKQSIHAKNLTSKFFSDLRYFRTQKFLDQKNFWNKIFSDQKYFLSQTLFWIRNSLRPKIFQNHFFWNSHFCFVKKILVPKFWSQIFSDPKYFWT